MDELKEPSWYVVQDRRGRIPDEFYCDDHLIGEHEYLAKHDLPDSGPIDVMPQDLDAEDGEPEDGGRCDFPGCPRIGHAS